MAPSNAMRVVRRWRAALVWVGVCSSMACGHLSPEEKSRLARRTPAYAQQLQQKLQARIGQTDGGARIGIFAVSLSDGAVLLAHNEEQRFTPASTTKVLTAATALQVLGPAFRFETQLWAEGLDVKGKVARNVVLRGSGDPSLQLGDVAEMVAGLRQLGIERVTGEIVIDDTAFDTALWARGWMWDDLAGGFSAPVSALNVAGNALSVTLSPAKRGEPVRVWQSPWTRFVSVYSAAETAPAGKASGLRLGQGSDAPALDGPPGPIDAFNGAPPSDRQLADVALVAGQKVVLSGSLAEGAPPQSKRLAVRNPAAWASALLREQLEQAGIAAPPSWRRGPVAPSATLVVEHHSAQLSELLFEALKSSNNHVLECVLKRLGATVPGQPGSFAGGTAVVRHFVGQATGALAGEEPVLFDGSGSSRYNLLTPKQLALLLAYVANRFEQAPELLVGLPIGGVDGTLAARQKGALRGQVRAKTGTMTGVSALAGLLHTADNDVLAFAILLDHFVGRSEQARALQDEVLSWLQPSPVFGATDAPPSP